MIRMNPEVSREIGAIGVDEAASNPGDNSHRGVIDLVVLEIVAQVHFQVVQGDQIRDHLRLLVVIVVGPVVQGDQTMVQEGHLVVIVVVVDPEWSEVLVVQILVPLHRLVLPGAVEWMLREEVSAVVRTMVHVVQKVVRGILHQWVVIVVGEVVQGVQTVVRGRPHR